MNLTCIRRHHYPYERQNEKLIKLKGTLLNQNPFLLKVVIFSLSNFVSCIALLLCRPIIFLTHTFIFNLLQANQEYLELQILVISNEK